MTKKLKKPSKRTLNLDSWVRAYGDFGSFSSCGLNW